MKSDLAKTWSLVVVSLGLALAAMTAVAVGAFTVIGSVSHFVGWLVLIFLWLAVLGITLALVESRAAAYTLIIGTAVILAVTGQLAPLSLIGAGIVLLLLVIARTTLRRDLNDRRVYRTATSFGSGSRYLIYSSLVAIAATLAVPVAERVQAGAITVSEGYVETVLGPVDPLLQRVRPELSSTATVDDLVVAQVGESVPQAAREVVYRQVAQQYGVESVSGDDTITSLLTKQLNAWLIRSTQAHPFLTTAVVLLGAVFVMRIFATPLQWLLLAIIAGLMAFARATDLASLEENSTEVETVQL